MKRIGIILCTVAMLMLSVFPFSASANEDKAAVHKQLISFSSDALISAGDADWENVRKAIAGLQQASLSLQKEEGNEAKAFTAALQEAEAALGTAESDPKRAYAAISALAKATDTYISAGDQDQMAAQIHEKIQTALLPILKETMTSVQAADWDAAKKSYNQFVAAWGKAETAIRKEDSKLYGRIEVKLSGARIALNTETPNQQQATTKLQDLITILEDYAAGRTTAPDSAENGAAVNSIAGLIALVEQVRADIQQKQAAAAYAKMETFVSSWPEVEGEVSTRSPQAYRDIENYMITLSSLMLSAAPDYAKASETADLLIQTLSPYAEASAYTVWDAFAILFREGLEAILIVAALLAMLKRSGNEDKRKWIWSGAAMGIVVSIAMALVLTVYLSNLSTGSSREMVEGISSLIAVIFMVTVGAWLHGKSNMKSWNRFVERTIGASLAKGALWSLSITAFLTVMREGAETIIFYLGMAPTIDPMDLLLGIGTAVLTLVVIAFAVLKASARIPITLFFRVAGLLMYYMAFKFLGVGIHALQVSGVLPAHATGVVPEISALGVYQSWEVIIPQLVVLIIILGSIIRVEWKRRTVNSGPTPEM
ncbi:FTR1 family iron permease [Brevibacillus migulae]|uniref:FTR1 family iron permease n=1 Tax=Brevibacillus migulae TaxID=1644114 RepID=UPI00106F09AF|nr:FTR1 family protein [Brevibacillus migulae]